MEAFRKLQEGKADVGFTFQTVAFPAWDGKGSWKGKKHRELRAVGFASSSSIFHFVVLKSSGIKKLADLSGKKFSPCPIGTTCYASVGSFLKHIGLYKKLRISNLSHGEQVSYLKDGKIDGYALQGGLPNPSVTEAALTRPVRLLSVDQGVDFSGFLKEFPGFEPTTIPKGTYKGVDYDVSTMGLSGILVANKNTSPDLIYQMTKTIWGKSCVGYLTKNNRGLAALKRANPTDGLVIPVHPGAARYWKEKGIKNMAPAEGSM
jgi:TRAP transporter TAXI family solute receptor